MADSTVRVVFLGDATSAVAATKSLGASLAGLQTVGIRMVALGSTLTKGLTLPIVALGGLSLKAASDFESSFAGVRKTVDATEQQFAQLADGFRQMAKEIPVSVDELNRIGEAAGQLGIKTENILEFTRTMADLGVTTNLSAEEAATALARLANITQMPQEQFDRLGSVIVELGNNLATTEREIVAFGLRIAGAGKQIGLTEDQILAIGAALSSVGIDAEAGGTAISRVMVEINKAVKGGTEELATFAKVAGQSAKDFAAAWQQDPAAALADFIEGLGKMIDEGENVDKILADLGLSNIRVSDALKRSAGAGDLLRRALKLAAREWKENSALTEEAAKRYETFQSRLAVVRNKLRDVGITLGNLLLPAAGRLVDGLGSLIEKAQEMARAFSQLSPETQRFVLLAAGIAAAIGPALIVLGKVTQTVGLLAGAFGFLLSPLGLVAAAIGGALLFALGDLVKEIPGAEKALSGLKETAGKAFAKLKDAIERVDWGALSRRIADGFAKLGDWLASVNWAGVAEKVASLLSAAIAAFPWGEALGALVQIAGGIVKGIVKGLANADWGRIMTAINDALEAALTDIGATLWQLIMGGSQADLERRMYNAGYDLAWNIGSGIKAGLATVAEAIAKFLEILASVDQFIADLDIPGISDAFGKSAEGLRAAADATRDWAAGLRDTEKPLSAHRRTVADVLSDWQTMAEQGRGTFAGISEGATSSAETIKVSASEAATISSARFGSMAGAIKGSIQAVAASAQAQFGSAAHSATQAAQTSQTQFGSMAGAVKGSLAGVAASAQARFAEAKAAASAAAQVSQSMFSGAAGAIKGSLSGVASAAQSKFPQVSSAAIATAGKFNVAAGAAYGIRDAVNSIPTSKIVEVFVRYHTGAGPGLQRGGIVRRPLTLVGEAGPELAALPIGTRVFPADVTRRFLARIARLGPAAAAAGAPRAVAAVGGQPIGEVVIQLGFPQAMSFLERYVDARVVKGSGKVSIEIGREADRRRREGRYR